MASHITEKAKEFGALVSKWTNHRGVDLVVGNVGATT
jgi:hypothetical protein